MWEVGHVTGVTSNSLTKDSFTFLLLTPLATSASSLVEALLAVLQGAAGTLIPLIFNLPHHSRDVPGPRFWPVFAVLSEAA